jgi:hypothetical protein
LYVSDIFHIYHINQASFSRSVYARAFGPTKNGKGVVLYLVPANGRIVMRINEGKNNRGR